VAASEAGGSPRPEVPEVTGLIEVESGVWLWYRMVGDGPGTVLVPTHGNDTELADLSVPGHRVVFYDLRGRGRSEPVEDLGRLGFAVTVDDIERVRAALGIGRFSALGWSWIAGALAAYARAHPDRIDRLVLVSPVPCRSGVIPAPAGEPAPGGLAAIDQLDADGLRDRDPVAYCRAWRQVHVPPLLGDPSGFVRLADVAPLANEWPWRVARSLVSVYADLINYDWRPELWALDRPVVVIRGELDRDPLSAAIEWVDALPDATLVRIGHVGSMPWVEHPEAFFDCANRFLAGDDL
jgi:pimeloyl-ACP methyl ester carboxylesterase